jgi:hypothetical protein
VNLFVIGSAGAGGVDAGIAERALRDLLARLPFFDPGAIRRWTAAGGRAAAAWVTHDPDRVGGVRYADADENGIALFSGRPFAWTGADSADGRAPLDAGFYRRPAQDWAAALDGRWCAATYDDRDGRLEVHSDALGAYPLYRGDAGAATWFSNSAAALRLLLDDGELDPVVLASVLAGGWSVTGEPVWRAVRRVQRTAPFERADTFDAGRAAAVLTGATGALADWPGRPSVVQLSGGRDSRLVFAAALAAGAEVTSTTGGPPDAPDVQIARELSDDAGIEHTAVADPGDPLCADPERAARVIGLAGGRAISLEHAAGYPLEPLPGPLPLWLNGQGGESAGGYYRPSADGPAAALLSRFADTGHLLSAHGNALVAGAISDAVGGTPPEDALDAFYVRRRMGAWAAMGHGCVEPSKGDTVAPLWCRRLLGDQLAAGERDRFAAGVLDVLAPGLAAVPYADGQVTPQRSPRDLSRVLAAVRGATVAQPEHAAWDVLDREAVDRALGDGADALAIWRLATVFLDSEEAA